MLPGACLAFDVSSLGVFLVPLGLLLALGLARRRAGVDALGLLAGLGAIIAWIGSLNLDYRACSSGSVTLMLSPRGPHSVSYSCGGVNGVPWVIAGTCAVAGALAWYLIATPPSLPAGANPMA